MILFPFPSKVIPLLPITIPSVKLVERVQVLLAEPHVPIRGQSPPVESSVMINGPVWIAGGAPSPQKSPPGTFEV